MSHEDRYDKDLKNYREFVQTDGQRAIEQYGISLLYSLNPADRVKALRDLGFDSARGEDYYNIGVQAISEENFTEAIINLKQALELDPTQTDAIYNLALCYEKTGHTPLAIQFWENYIEVCPSEDDKAMIEEHLKDLR